RGRAGFVLVVLGRRGLALPRRRCVERQRSRRHRRRRTVDARVRRHAGAPPVRVFVRRRERNGRQAQRGRGGRATRRRARRRAGRPRQRSLELRPPARLPRALHGGRPRPCGRRPGRLPLRRGVRRARAAPSLRRLDQRVAGRGGTDGTRGRVAARDRRTRRGWPARTTRASRLNEPAGATITIAMTSAARPNLSFCTVTDDPIATARTVAHLRGIADEIIVAVDERAADDNDVLTDVDRLVTVEYRPPPERILPWVHAQCTGRWRLRLDADEVPSAAFLTALPDLIEVDDVTHYYLSRRWLDGDPDSFLSVAPWYPDFQLRLVRNDPSVDAPPSKVHELPPIEGAMRFLEQGVYHLDLLVNSYEVRRRRASEYERMRPGVWSEGLSVNAGFYLPEGRAVQTAPVPAEDRDQIARRLSPSPRTP